MSTPDVHHLHHITASVYSDFAVRLRSMVNLKGKWENFCV